MDAHRRRRRTIAAIHRRPLLIAAHGFGSDGVDVMFDYHHAAAARLADGVGRLPWRGLESFYVPDYATGLPEPGIGKRTFGSRASQWDILDILNYMQANYNVDPAHLPGRPLDGRHDRPAGRARWTDRFAAVVADNNPTDLIAWEDETNSDPADLARRRTPLSTTPSAPRPEPTASPITRLLSSAFLRTTLRVRAPLARAVGGQLSAPALVDSASGGDVTVLRGTRRIYTAVYS